MTDKNHELTVKDKEANNTVEGYICDSCYQRMIDSYHNKRSFKLSMLKSWTKKKTPGFHR